MDLVLTGFPTVFQSLAKFRVLFSSMHKHIWDSMHWGKNTIGFILECDPVSRNWGGLDKIFSIP